MLVPINLVFLLQMTLWVLLATAWLLPLAYSMIMNIKFATVYGSDCAIYYEAQITYLFVTYYLPFCLMFVMTIVLIVICCKQRGKDGTNHLIKKVLFLVAYVP